MNWLYEEPLFIIVVGVTTTAILGGIWLQTGRKPLVVAVVLSVLVTLALVLVERAVQTDREQVEATLQRIARQIERNDLDAVLSHVHSGATRIHRRARHEFRRYDFEQVSIKQNLEISVDADHDPKTAAATFNVVVILSDRSGILEDRRIPRFVELSLEMEEGVWRVTDYDHHEPQMGYQRRSGNP